MSLRDPDNNSSLNRLDNNNSFNLSSNLGSMCPYRHCLNNSNLNNNRDRNSHRDHNNNLHRDSNNSFRPSLTSRDNSKFLLNSLLSSDSPHLRMWLSSQGLNLNNSLSSSQPSPSSPTQRGC